MCAGAKAELVIHLVKILIHTVCPEISL